jgi:hypothetical protein
MQIIGCPNCWARIKAPDHTSGALTCPGCHQSFDIDGDASLFKIEDAPQNVSKAAKITQAEPGPPAWHQSRSKAAIAVTACVVLSAAAWLLVPTLREVRSRPGPKIEQAADPYTPDCRIIRDYLSRHCGPVEVVGWGNRAIFNSVQLGGSVALSATWRRVGERQRMTGHFTIGPFNTVESVMILD